MVSRNEKAGRRKPWWGERAQEDAVGGHPIGYKLSDWLGTKEPRSRQAPTVRSQFVATMAKHNPSFSAIHLAATYAEAGSQLACTRWVRRDTPATPSAL